MATKLEEKLAKMTPAERKKAIDAISSQMGMPTKKRATAKSAKKNSKK